jgi:putative transposase
MVNNVYGGIASGYYSIYYAVPGNYNSTSRNICPHAGAQGSDSFPLLSAAIRRRNERSGADQSATGSALTPQFVDVFSAVRNHFVPPRSHRSALSIHLHRPRAIAEWKLVAALAARPALKTIVFSFIHGQLT